MNACKVNASNGHGGVRPARDDTARPQARLRKARNTRAFRPRAHMDFEKSCYLRTIECSLLLIKDIFCYLFGAGA